MLLWLCVKAAVRAGAHAWWWDAWWRSLIKESLVSCLSTGFAFSVPPLYPALCCNAYKEVLLRDVESHVVLFGWGYSVPECRMLVLLAPELHRMRVPVHMRVQGPAASQVWPGPGALRRLLH
jgi:hypothetical protein